VRDGDEKNADCYNGTAGPGGNDLAPRYPDRGAWRVLLVEQHFILSEARRRQSRPAARGTSRVRKLPSHGLPRGRLPFRSRSALRGSLPSSELMLHCHPLFTWHTSALRKSPLVNGTSRNSAAAHARSSRRRDAEKRGVLSNMDRFLIRETDRDRAGYHSAGARAACRRVLSVSTLFFWIVITRAAAIMHIAPDVKNAGK
jgi:hypothetical protein